MAAATVALVDIIPVDDAATTTTTPLSPQLNVTTTTPVATESKSTAATIESKSEAVGHLKKEPGMRFLTFHKKVRNDDHCPVCKRYYVSVHRTQASACGQLDTDKFSAKQLKRLENGEAIWIDEWVRRSNGDRYQILRIVPEESYHLNNLASYCDLSSDAKDIGVCGDDLRYMLLHVHVDKAEICPDNVILCISFYATVRIATFAATEAVTECKKSECSKAEISKLSELEPVWINKNDTTTKDSGDHYQIVKLVEGETMYLNSYCSQIRRKGWSR